MEERPDDQDWGSLPENCPIREQGREAFDELWGGIETWALAVVDPYPDSSNRIEYAWMFVWLISDLDSEDWTSVTGLGEKARKVRQVEEFQKHLYWLLIKGSAEELELLLKNHKILSLIYEYPSLHYQKQFLFYSYNQFHAIFYYQYHFLHQQSKNPYFVAF